MTFRTRWWALCSSESGKMYENVQGKISIKHNMGKEKKRADMINSDVF